MVNSILNSQVLTKNPAKETLLTPRFYTTDFEETHVYNFTLNSFVLHNKLLHDLVFQ